MSESGSSGAGCLVIFAIVFVMLFAIGSCSDGSSSSSKSSSSSSSKPTTAYEAASQYYYDSEGHIHKK